jgi:hypothetical protein
MVSTRKRSLLAEFNCVPASGQSPAASTLTLIGAAGEAAYGGGRSRAFGGAV